MRTNQVVNFALGLALSSLIFFAELVLPWAYLAYLTMAIYLWKVPTKSVFTPWLGAITSILIIAGYIIRQDITVVNQPAIVNRVFLLCFIWLGVVLQREHKRVESKKKRLIHDLDVLKKDKKSIENEMLKVRRLHDAMAHHFPDGVICILNKEMKYIFVGGQGLVELGMTGREIAGEEAAIGSGVELRKAFSGEKVSFETVINGNHYAVSAVPVVDARSEINEILIVIRNITDRKKLENNLIRALEKEKELSLMRSQFVTMASHKFRTPLSTILSSVFLLENNVEADAQEKTSYFEKVKRSVHSITALLNDFLSLGKLEEGKVKVAFSETDIKAFFYEFVQEIGSIKKEKQKIIFSYDGLPCTVMTDQLLLKNILMSLLSNAIEYSSYEAEIQLTVELKKDNLKIKVSDQGIGIPEEDQHQIFKRFYRGQNTNNVDGTGLGLNIAKKYIRLLRGTIDFTSQVNKGTTFTANIPVVTLDILEKQV
jgi:signal transduction histidine kinase